MSNFRLKGCLLGLIVLFLTFQPGHAQKAQLMKETVKRALKFLGKELVKETVKQGIVYPLAEEMISDTKIDQWTRNSYNNLVNSFKSSLQDKPQDESVTVKSSFEELQVAQHIIDTWTPERAIDIDHITRCPTCYNIAYQLSQGTKSAQLFTTNKLIMSVPSHYVINGVIYIVNSEGSIFRANGFTGDPAGPVEGFLWYDGSHFYGVNLLGNMYYATPVEFTPIWKTPRAVVNNVYVEHNVYQNGRKGMLIHVDFSIENHKNFEVQVMAYFYSEDGRALRDFDGDYRTYGGEVFANGSSIPPYESTRFTDFKVFLPYDELHFTGHGRYLLKCSIRVYSPFSNSFLTPDSVFPFELTVGY